MPLRIVRMLKMLKSPLAGSRIDTAMTEIESNAPTIRRTTQASLRAAAGWFAKR
jgi:hypothetical protein